MPGLNAEQPRFYEKGKNNFPEYIIQEPNGLLSVSPNFAPEHAGSKYQMIIDFGITRQTLRGLIPEKKRIHENRHDLIILSLHDELVTDIMANITTIANDPNKSWKNSQDRREYRTALGSVYLEVAKTTKKLLDPEKPTLFFPPKNGGIYVEKMFRQVFTDPKKAFYDYQMSRIWTIDQGLMVGVNIGPNNPNIADFRQIVISDDCIASDVSAWGTMEMIKEETQKNNVLTNEVDVVIAVSAATQAGIESLLSDEAKEHFGFKSIRAVVATLAHQMNDHYYLQHPDGRQVVGDMGNWTKPVE